jgi:hypothetical protein
VVSQPKKGKTPYGVFRQRETQRSIDRKELLSNWPPPAVTAEMKRRFADKTVNTPEEMAICTRLSEQRYTMLSSGTTIPVFDEGVL